MMEFFQDDDDLNAGQTRGKKVFTVTEITREIKLTLEEGFTSLWVIGEISNLKRHSSGHLYFSLKDADAQISCVMWRGRTFNLLFQPRDGMKVLLFGNVTLYEKQGKYQLDVQRIQPAGRGELQLAFEELKKRLAGEGLFSEDRKRPLPDFPEAIGIVTSPTGAAIRDILSVIHRRFPSVKLILYPVLVQGEGAPAAIVRAIGDFNAWGGVDVLIVGRGGGSLEDLWAFNTEEVARAIVASEIPVISAVGHEIDFSISDFVADVRAPTPSAAAELVVPDRQELFGRIQYLAGRSRTILDSLIGRYRDGVTSLLRSYGLRSPANMVRERRLRLDETMSRMENGIGRILRDRSSAAGRLLAKLEVLDPAHVLKRGYSITTRMSDGRVVAGSSMVSPGDGVRIRFQEGSVKGTVDEIENRGQHA